MSCEVCNNESGGTDIGVACIPGVPMSIMWCSECIKRNCVPSFVLEHDFVFVAHGDLNALAEWARERETWADGKYISFAEYAKRISPKMVEEQINAYNESLERPTQKLPTEEGNSCQ